jgi:hypothetical protein
MRIAMAKNHLIENIILDNTELRNILVRFYVSSVALYESETWKQRKYERGYLESF